MASPYTQNPTFAGVDFRCISRNTNPASFMTPPAPPRSFRSLSRTIPLSLLSALFALVCGRLLLRFTSNNYQFHALFASATIFM